MSAIVPRRWTQDGVWVDEAPMTSADQVTTAARTDKVLYSPRGDEILRIRDRPLLGFHAQNGREL